MFRGVFRTLTYQSTELHVQGVKYVFHVLQRETTVQLVRVKNKYLRMVSDTAQMPLSFNSHTYLEHSQSLRRSVLKQNILLKIFDKVLNRPL